MRKAGTNDDKHPPPPNVPYFLALFLASPKKKGEKEGRLPAEHGSVQAGHSDAAGLIFRESLQKEPAGGREFREMWIFGFRLLFQADCRELIAVFADFRGNRGRLVLAFEADGDRRVWCREP